MKKWFLTIPTGVLGIFLFMVMSPTEMNRDQIVMAYNSTNSYIADKESITQVVEDYADISSANVVYANMQLGDDIVEYAKTFVGNKYIFGGEDINNGIDCSAFTQQVFKHFNITLPRTSREQVLMGEEVSRDEAMPGDLIFYSTNKTDKGVHHVAIYCGENRRVHAWSSNTGIVYNPDAFDSSHLYKIIRILD